MSEYQKIKANGNQKREETKGGNKEAIAGNNSRYTQKEINAFYETDGWWAGNKKAIEKKLNNGQYIVKDGRLTSTDKKPQTTSNTPKKSDTKKELSRQETLEIVGLGALRGRGQMLPNLGRDGVPAIQQSLIDKGYARLVRGRVRITSEGIKVYKSTMKDANNWLDEKRKQKRDRQTRTQND